MKTIVLPGYSLKNKDWAYEVKNKLHGFNIEVCEWEHWKNPEIKFSPKNEVEKIKKIVGEGQVNIIAKSIGTLVAATFIGESAHRLNKVVLCGICINDLNEDELHRFGVLADLDPKKIVVYQNSEDSHGSFEEVRKFLSQINPNILIVEKAGSSHDYPYYEDFEKFLK